MRHFQHPAGQFQEGDDKDNPKYNSQELDKESNYYYYNARYYDPEIARFVTPDSVIDGEDDTQGWNRYAYCHGNPLLYKDPSGHERNIKLDVFGTPLGNQQLSSEGSAYSTSSSRNVNYMIRSNNGINAGNASSPGSAMGAAVEQLSAIVESCAERIAKNRAKCGTVQYATSVVISSIENIMERKSNEYNQNGNKKVLQISAEEIITHTYNRKVPEQMLVEKGRYGSGNFEKGKTLGENFQNGYQKIDVRYSEMHIKRLAEAFVQGQQALDTYYKETSSYYGQGFNEDWKFLRMDDHSAISEKQYEELKEIREKFNKDFNK